MQILKIHLPFIEGTGSKPRPVLQLNNPGDEHGNFQVAFITSQKPQISFGNDIKIDENNPEFQITGLFKTSYIRFKNFYN